MRRVRERQRYLRQLEMNAALQGAQTPPSIRIQIEDINWFLAAADKVGGLRAMIEQGHPDAHLHAQRIADIKADIRRKTNDREWIPDSPIDNLPPIEPRKGHGYRVIVRGTAFGDLRCLATFNGQMFRYTDPNDMTFFVDPSVVIVLSAL